MLAYYYQWFDPASWSRAKTDYPALGRYSSDDTAVMRKHVEAAKAAGITGFIVSWKGSEANNRRLRALADVAGSKDFSLGVIYQSLDFDRNPLPAQRVATDLRYFRDTFARNPVFRVLDRPMVIWAGTWKFSHRTRDGRGSGPGRRTHARLREGSGGLSAGRRIFEGDAYYWSSVDPGAGHRLRGAG